ncbi:MULTISPECIES: cytochrome-c oxidase, cbb3-type subunit III [Achromobacter]|uniref:Cbb3-type cytochrome c oxidase subunit n=1 Tax=Alcaligenes xylosoxydans xylosoxydans TaxID=85698 RepID=A0A424WEP4_ALCXX|nr:MULTISPECIES: cytochrome-c oxidase, cbb3-type subunit III [Achromobacter]MBC9904475.1 cytochrome-c oxidase, cbb3-type subunit III [Achromobacter xylosoxidans]MBD0869420.1 cytochrome-c oxidase, cbb3-type subunit III [Achromobacter xylosoxidans]MDH1304601.1 cytochrome-c oxidase, cbb3-type subunit III [Achromobacter sp. GD03932]QNP88040.1 cytochrome-c oxidase, cbb3-type subunit III [Achromobacter xylosoxidans]RPJ91725.1 cytochrome-c oxidase, cbb3-type subunit III [Achromobacter xylosoxidans]
MSDFVNGFWGYFISIVAVGGVVWCVWLLYTQRRWLSTKPANGKVEDTGHVWDGDLTELNNPVPGWWTWMYLLACAFALGYLFFMPGLGEYKGQLGYSSTEEVARQQAKMAEAVRPIYARFETMDIPQIAQDPGAREIGQRLFLNTCAQCHGSDAKGGPSFPNLADGDWLHGGSPEAITQTITQGRVGVMPPWKAAIDAKTAADIAQYVRSLSGLTADPVRVFRGKREFANYCVACHGVDGKGNQALGAPNLTDDVWLYGSSEATIVKTILDGRDNRMPAHGDILTPEQIKILTAWVWGLSNKPEATAGAAPGTVTK